LRKRRCITGLIASPLHRFTAELLFAKHPEINQRHIGKTYSVRCHFPTLNFPDLSSLQGE
jgi:hypothetical protein